MDLLITISCKVGAQRQRQQVLPLAIVALKAHAFGDLKCSDDESLDLLSGSVAGRRYYLLVNLESRIKAGTVILRHLGKKL